ncbi:hypothetical protein Tco_0897325 [Tanacetum coccineum]
MKERTTHSEITDGTWSFEHTKEVFITQVIPFLNSLRESFKDLENGLHDELNEMKKVFNQMEAAVEQCSVDKKFFYCQKKELLLANDRLLELINKESFQNNRSFSNLDAPTMNEFFVINDLKAQLQAKESSISKLRAHIATLKGINVSDNNESVNSSSVLTLRMFRAQVDQESQIKMIQVKEMMQDNDLKNSKSKDKGSRSRSQSMNEQSHYKQDKTKTRQSINVKSHIFNVIGGTEEFEERDLNIGGDC